MSDPKINFLGVIETIAGDPAVFLNTEDSVHPDVAVWYNVNTFDENAVDPGVDTGWSVVQVNEFGITRADIEGAVPTPTPVIQNKYEAKALTMYPYPDGTVFTQDGAVELGDAPEGHFGAIQISYELEHFEDGSSIIRTADVQGIVSPT